jgi:excisionase family DNA binding protein
MTEQLLNIKEAAEYLGIGEKAVKDLVEAGEIPAYKIGGAFLRFKKSQLASAKASLYGKERPHYSEKAKVKAKTAGASASDLGDFLYFNDFYILSFLVIIAAIVLMIAT